jgi:hypothetical protein
MTITETLWMTTTPTPEQFLEHAKTHPSQRFAGGRAGALWLLRPKPLPIGWNEMSPAQRARTRAMTARVLGSYPTVVEAIEDACNPGVWSVYQHDSHKPYSTVDLHAYDWCPLTSRGDIAPIPGTPADPPTSR